MAKDEVTNTIVSNQGLNPLVNYNFMLRVEGLFDLPCKAVHSFTKENEYDENFFTRELKTFEALVMFMGKEGMKEPKRVMFKRWN